MRSPNVDLLLLLTLSLTACATGAPRKTVHDYCVEHLDHYASYEECHHAVSQSRKQARKDAYADAERQNRLLRGLNRAGNTIGNALTSPTEIAPSVSCTSNTYGNSTTTQCQ